MLVSSQRHPLSILGSCKTTGLAFDLTYVSHKAAKMEAAFSRMLPTIGGPRAASEGRWQTPIGSVHSTHEADTVLASMLPVDILAKAMEKIYIA